MSKSRRNFLQAGSLAFTGAFFAGGADSLLAEVPGKLKPELTPADREVIAFLKNFSGRVLLLGGCVAAKINGSHCATHLVAETTNLDHLVDCMLEESHQRFGICHAVKNTVTLKKDETEFTIETLLPPQFAERVRNLQLSGGGDIKYPHEALQFDPDSGELADPFGVLKETEVTRLVREPYTRIVKKMRRMKNGRRKIKRIRKRAFRLVQKPMPGVEAELRLFPANETPEDAFSTLANALIDRICFGLSPDESFEIDKKRVLETSTSLSPEQSEKVCREFIQAVSSLAEDREAVEELLESPLLSRCLEETFGVNAAEILESFNRLRAGSDSSYTDGSIWTALLLFDEIQQGKDFPWIDQNDKLRLLKSKADLAQAALAFLR